jgi:hypothetical protein
MNIRVKKIITLYKIAADSTDILKTMTKEVQQALLDAGYSLPRYGADGRLGEETYVALLKFKEDKKLPKTKTLSKTEFDILKQNNNGVKVPVAVSSEIEGVGKNVGERILSPASEASGSNLLFGDSQMQGGIGQVLHGKFGGTKLARPGTSARYWYKSMQLEEELKKNPKNIIIQLNGNGIDGTDELIQKIKKITPNSNIIWYGAPPATLRGDSEYTRVNNDKKVIAFNRVRKNNNNIVASILNSYNINGRFIDPFDELFGVEINNPKPYLCNGCDGVHVPKNIAQKYYT